MDFSGRGFVLRGYPQTIGYYTPTKMYTYPKKCSDGSEKRSSDDGDGEKLAMF